MNKTLFAPATSLTTNNAGGLSYELDSRAALFQLAVIGCFQNTFYTTAKDQLNKLMSILPLVSDEYIAKVAIYASRKGNMKDMPVFLLAYLSTRKNNTLFESTFNAIIKDLGAVKRFVQVIRSGQVGRKSLGSQPKRLISNFLGGVDPNRLFFQSPGTNPSFKDVIALVHPVPATVEHEALFGYFMDRSYIKRYLPSLVTDFENFKQNPQSAPPAVDFRLLSNISMSKEQWFTVARGMTWNQLRLNLNLLNRQGVFTIPEAIEYVYSTLIDEKKISKKILPFALYSTIQNIAELPSAIQNAVRHAYIKTFDNVPIIEGNTAVFVDISGSMTAAALGAASDNPLTCQTVAAYFASAIKHKNFDKTDVYLFDTVVQSAKSFDRELPLALVNDISQRYGGGTSISSCFEFLTRNGKTYDNIFIISDNESWVDFYIRSSSVYTNTRSTNLWDAYKNKNPNSKLVLWDIAPNTHTQVKTQKDVLNIGGFTDSVFDLYKYWSISDSISNIEQLLDNSIKA